MSKLDELDVSAKANLRENDLREYFRYKKELLDDNELEDSVHDILTGFIWDVTESYEIDDSDS